MARRRDEKWHEFERAVARLVSAIDPSAHVRHDVRLPDRHTGKARQRDVWVDARVGMFPVSILISCKRLKRRINALDIDHFNGELQSSRAHKGVLFSYSAFGDDALAKAAALGIECCRLYVNTKCDLPSALKLRVYCCTAHVGINPIVVPHEWNIGTLGELFAIPVVFDDGRDATAAVSIADHFRHRMAQAATQLNNERIFPSDWSQTLGLQPLDDSVPEVRVIVSGIWRIFEADIDLHLLDGAYSHTTDLFFGSQKVPQPLVKYGSPGPGWREISYDHASPDLATLTLLYNPNTIETTLEQMRDFPVKTGGA